MMVLAAIVGVARSIERAQRPDDRGHHAMRAVVVLVLCVAAVGGAEGWRQWLYAALMPLGAYFAARSVSAPIARLFAVQRHTSVSVQSGRNTPQW